MTVAAAKGFTENDKSPLEPKMMHNPTEIHQN